MRFQIPANVTVRPGQYVRFDSTFGRFIEVTSYAGHGLGFLFQMQRDGKLVRVFF